MIDLMIGVYVHVSPGTMGTQRGRGRGREEGGGEGLPVGIRRVDIEC